MTKPPVRKLDQSDYVKSALRLPRDLHAQVADDAVRNGRSMNAEIIARLGVSPLADLAADVVDVKAMVRKLLYKD